MYVFLLLSTTCQESWNESFWKENVGWNYFWNTLYIRVPNHSSFGRNKSNSKLGRVLKQRIRTIWKENEYISTSSFESFHFSVIQLFVYFFLFCRVIKRKNSYAVLPINLKIQKLFLIFYNIFQNIFIGKILVNNVV